MRARIVLAVVIVVVFLAGALVGAQRLSERATAHEPLDRRPLLFSQISSWCQIDCQAAMTDLPNGYVRVIFQGGCYSLGDIPPFVEGDAYVRTGTSRHPEYVEDVTEQDEVCELVIRRL